MNKKMLADIEELYAVENRTETQQRVLDHLREMKAAEARTDALDRAWRERED